MNGHEGL